MQDNASQAEPVKVRASCFPSIEKKYGRPVEKSQHMELVAWLNDTHGLGHGHAMRFWLMCSPGTKKEAA